MLLFLFSADNDDRTTVNEILYFSTSCSCYWNQDEWFSPLRHPLFLSRSSHSHCISMNFYSIIFFHFLEHSRVYESAVVSLLLPATRAEFPLITNSLFPNDSANFHKVKCLVTVQSRTAIDMKSHDVWSAAAEKWICTNVNFPTHVHDF